MASQSDPGLVSAYETMFAENRAACAMTALIAYEHIITIKYDMDFLFRKKWSASTWILLFNRYSLLATVLFIITPTTPQSCNSQAMNTLSFFTSGAFSVLPLLVFTVLRGFAILQDHPWRMVITGTLVMLALSNFVSATYIDFTQDWVYIRDPTFGAACIEFTPHAASKITHRLSVAISVIRVLFEVLVLIVTVAKTALQVRQASALGLGTTLSEIMLRDGSLFLLLIVFAQILDPILFNTRLGIVLGQAVTNDLGIFINILPPLLLSRFIINLRQIDSSSADSTANQHLSRFSVPNFRMPTMDEVIGNLGEPLEFVEYGIDDIDEIHSDDDAEACTNVEQEGTDRTSSTINFTADLEAASPLSRAREYEEVECKP